MAMALQREALPHERLEATNVEIVNEIRACHSKSLSLAAEAVAQDEDGNKGKAIELYLKSLRHIEDGMRHEVHDILRCGPEWDTARQMQEAMAITLDNIKQRIYELQTFHGNEGIDQSENPPPYSVRDPFAQNLQTGAPNSQLANVEPVLSIESGVQMYFVSDENQVGAAPPSYPTFLRVIILPEDCTTFQGPEAIMQVGDWIYPLAKQQMPVLRSCNGAYVFPNCTIDGVQQGSAVGIVISSSVPRGYVEMFESLLHNYSLFQTSDPDDGFVDLTECVEASREEVEQACLSNRLSNSLATGADMVSHGIQKGSEYATELVEQSSKKIHEKISPYTTPLTISPTVKKGLTYTYQASHTTVKISRWLVDWLCTITSKVGEQIGPYFKTQVAGNTSSENQSGFYNVARAGLVSFGKIWLELEKAGTVIAQAVTSAAVKSVEFKYGPEAGHAANLAMGAAVNIGTTAFMLDNLAIKAVAEASAKDSQREVVNDQSNKPAPTVQNSHDEKDISRDAQHPCHTDPSGNTSRECQ